MCMASFEAVGVAFRRVLPTPHGNRLPVPPPFLPLPITRKIIIASERICRGDNKDPSRDTIIFFVIEE